MSSNLIRFYYLLQIHIHKLKHQTDVGVTVDRLRLDDIQQFDNVVVFEKFLVLLVVEEKIYIFRKNILKSLISRKIRLPS